MYKIHCLNNISQTGLAILPDSYKIVDKLNGADAIMLRSYKMHDLDLPTSVLAVARAGAGVNNIPLDRYADQGVVVFNTPGANANAVKELTVAGLFLASRNIDKGINWINNHKEDIEIDKTIEKAKKAFAGTEVFGKTIGIIGLGSIGLMLARTCAALGMNVLGTKRNLDTLKDDILPEKMKLVKTREDIYAQSDFISLNIPLNDHTKHMINKNAFKQMKDGVILLNFARAGLVHDDDLENALLSKKVRSYVTDFPNFKTANLENVVAIPHLGASTMEAEENCAMMASLQIKDYLEHGIIKNSVNYPDIELPHKVSKFRISILYQIEEIKREKMVSEIISQFKHIDHAYQAFYDGNGVIVIDVNDEIKSTLLDKMKSNESIKHIRVI